MSLVEYSQYIIYIVKSPLPLPLTPSYSRVLFILLSDAILTGYKIWLEASTSFLTHILPAESPVPIVTLSHAMNNMHKHNKASKLLRHGGLICILQMSCQQNCTFLLSCVWFIVWRLRLAAGYFYPVLISDKLCTGLHDLCGQLTSSGHREPAEDGAVAV